MYKLREHRAAQGTATNAVANAGGEGSRSRGTVAVEQDPGRNSNSSAPDHSGGETSANSAGGDSFREGVNVKRGRLGRGVKSRQQPSR
jgi:hypothetical protein